jgi:hypothetical protein
MLKGRLRILGIGVISMCSGSKVQEAVYGAGGVEGAGQGREVARGAGLDRASAGTREIAGTARGLPG